MEEDEQIVAAAPAPEFPTDEHRASHVAGLVREKEGYAARVTAAKEAGDELAVGRYERRGEQVQAQLDRLSADAQPAAKRAQRR